MDTEIKMGGDLHQNYYFYSWDSINGSIFFNAQESQNFDLKMPSLLTNRKLNSANATIRMKV